MPRRFALLAVSATIAFAAVLGCGPGNPAPSTQQAAPTLTVGLPQPTQGRPTATATRPNAAAGRKTFTRKEMEKWWLDSQPTMTTANMKTALGPPDSTREFQYVGFGGGTATAVEWIYLRLTVDAEGSEKVDSETRFRFRKDGTPFTTKIEFVP